MKTVIVIGEPGFATFDGYALGEKDGVLQTMAVVILQDQRTKAVPLTDIQYVTNDGSPIPTVPLYISFIFYPAESPGFETFNAFHSGIEYSVLKDQLIAQALPGQRIQIVDYNTFVIVYNDIKPIPEG